MNTLFGEMTPNTGVDGKPLETIPDPEAQKLVDDIPYDGEEGTTPDELPTETEGKTEEVETTEEGKEVTTGDTFSYLGVAESFAEDGILTPDPEKEYEDSEEGFKEVIQDTVKAQFEATYGLPDNEHLAYLAFIKQGGTNSQWLEQTTFSYENLDLEDEDTQKELLTRQYQAQGISETQIAKKIARLEAAGTLEEEAKDAQEFLVEKEKKEVEAFKAQTLKQEEEAKEQSKNYLVTLQKDIEGTETLAGIPLTPNLRKGLFAHLTKPVGPKGETQYQLNQKDKTKALSGVLLDFLGLDPTEVVAKKGETQKANKLQTSLKAFNRGDKSGGGQTVNTITAPNKNRIPTKGMPWGS